MEAVNFNIEGWKNSYYEFFRASAEERLEKMFSGKQDALETDNLLTSFALL